MPKCNEGTDLRAEVMKILLLSTILSLEENMGLEIDNEDVAELLKDTKDVFSMEELEQLQKQLERTVVEEMSSDVEEERENVPTLVYEICVKWNKVFWKKTFV